MVKYHINDSGTPGVCKAKPGACKFGSEFQHYSSKEKAQQAFELSMKAETFSQPQPDTNIDSDLDKKLTKAKVKLRSKFNLYADSDYDLKQLAAIEAATIRKFDDKSIVLETPILDPHEKRSNTKALVSLAESHIELSGVNGYDYTIEELYPADKKARVKLSAEKKITTVYSESSPSDIESKTTPIEQFFWDKDKTFIGEASETGIPQFLKGRNGEIVELSTPEQIIDSEGEVLSWKMKPLDSTKQWSVLIFND